MVDYTKYGILGAFGAVGLGASFKFISGIVSKIPGVSLDLQSVSIQTTGLTNVINPGLSVYAQKILGMVPMVTAPEWLYLAIGGALFVMLGAYLVEQFKLLQFAKTKVGKLATIFVVASIVSGWILSMSIGLPAMGVIITMAVDSILLAWILNYIDESANLKLLP